ncbi:thiaminase II [Sporolactobacillus sp. STSJ-5]|uniref:thiaminase II n=1 Tax=Sporolactobacillus sp. STSJ-5 TaxID=2965076 RepID=UPI002103736C|nr:thiaminase II [Sporolactobacillus sp. STSJ-5]MCQ2008382.1 thiaminase II [Sporolactobacillus sp. STSJ-5]
MEGISNAARKFSDDLWNRSFNHPFVQGIKNGTLASDQFRFYIKQDAYYVREFAKLHGRAAAQTDDAQSVAKLLKIGLGLAEGELQLHQSVFQKLGISDQEWRAFQPAPDAYAYISHLYHVVSKGKLGYTLAALMPCPWLYYEIGLQLKDARPQAKIFQEWIAEYSSEDIEKNVGIERELWDEVSKNATESERHDMIHIFMQSSYYELKFWEMGASLNDWLKQEGEERANDLNSAIH